MNNVDGSGKRARVSMVAALGRGRALGRDNQLLWHIPDDLKRFKMLTLGHPIIMGRNTFESVVAMRGAALPERTNIVVTRNTRWHYPGTVVAHSLEEALAKARALDTEELFICGGGQLYADALPYADRLYLTLIDDTKEADAFFPAYESTFTRICSEESRVWQTLPYRWVDLERA